MSRDIDELRAELMKLFGQLRAELSTLARSGTQAPEWVIGSASAWDPVASAAATPRLRFRQGFGLASDMSYIGLDRFGRFVISENDGTETRLGGMMYNTEITLTGATGTPASDTVFYITETSTGSRLPLDRKTVVLIRGGQTQRPSGTDGSIDAGTNFTLDAGGTQLTTSAAPGVAPGINFFIAQARRKATS